MGGNWWFFQRFWNQDWRFSWKLKTDQHWHTKIEEITKFIAHKVCVMRQGLVPLGKPTYIFMLKWMKSQSLSHTICVMSQRPSAPRKTHIYIYIEMDEITMCVLSQRPTMVLSWWPIAMEWSQRFASSSSATLVPGNFLWVLYHQSVCMKYQARLLCKLFLACSADFSCLQRWCKRLAYQPLLTT
jgi:hypothetical protein